MILGFGVLGTLSKLVIGIIGKARSVNHNLDLSQSEIEFMRDYALKWIPNPNFATKTALNYMMILQCNCNQKDRFHWDSQILKRADSRVAASAVSVSTIFLRRRE